MREGSKESLGRSFETMCGEIKIGIFGNICGKVCGVVCAEMCGEKSYWVERGNYMRDNYELILGA